MIAPVVEPYIYPDAYSDSCPNCGRAAEPKLAFVGACMAADEQLGTDAVAVDFASDGGK